LHPCSSISSLLPATRTLGALASAVIVGSFCLFCENGVVGLPLETSVSGVDANAVAPAMSANRAATGIAETLFMSVPPLNGG